MDQTMTAEDVQQTINETIEELGLGPCSVAKHCIKAEFVHLEFAAFPGNREEIEANFSALAKRHGWKHCRVYVEGTNSISVAMRPEGPYFQFLTPMPTRQAMLLAAE